MDHLMTLLKPIHNTTMPIPYEQFFIPSLHQEGQLIPEQYPGEQNLLIQLAADPLLHTTWRNYSSNIRHTEHIVYAAALRTSNLLQHLVRTF